MSDTITKGYIAKEDMSHFDGVNSTVSRKTSTGGSQSLTPIDWVGVDAYVAYGTSYGKTAACIQNVIDSLGSTNATVYLSPGAWTIDANLTIPSTVELRIPFGALLTVSAGVTMTVNGHISAGDYAIFTGAGTLDVSSYAGPFIFPTWGLSASSTITLVGNSTVSGTLAVTSTLAVTGNVDFNGNEDLAGTLDIGASTTRRVAPAGTFANVGTGNPLISDTSLTVSTAVAETTWESVGPTGAGADNTWTALDSVPTDADWIEVKINGVGNSTGDTANTSRQQYVSCRKNGSTEAVDAKNMIYRARSSTDDLGYKDIGNCSISKVPVDTDIIFDVYWESTYNNTTTLLMYLVGWGFNP